MLSGRWLLFAILFASRTAIAYQFQSVASVGPFIVDALAIDFASLGLLIGCHMLPGVALALPGGLLDQRFGARPAVMLGLGLMTLGGAVMAPGTISLLFAGRIVSGAGAAILNVVLARMVTARFTDGELVAVMGAFVASWPLGVALSLVSVPSIAMAYGWAAVTLAATLPAFLCFLVFAIVYRGRRPEDGSGEAAALRLDLSGRQALLVGLAGLIWGLYNVAYVVFVAALPEFFVELGHPLTEAAAFASLLGWVLIVSLPAGGYLGQRLGRPDDMMVVCFLVIAAAAVSLALTAATTLSFLLLALFIGLPAGLIMAVPAQVLAPEARPGGMGIFFTIFYVAMATLPGLAGLMRQQTGDVASPFLFGAATMGAACLVVLCLSRLRGTDAA